MAIVSSTYQAWAAWPGFIHVQERHVDHTGVAYYQNRTVPDTADVAAIMAERAITLAVELADVEFEEIVNG